MKKKINLMIGPKREGQGGISTVINSYCEMGFIDENNIKLVSVNKPGVSNFLMKLFFALSITKIIFLLLFFKVEIAHMHMASRGSYSRKSFLIRLLKYFRVKVILHLHGAEFRDFYSSECSQDKQQHIRNTFMMVDKVLVLSSQWLKWAAETFPSTQHFQVLYNSVIPISNDGCDSQCGKVVFLGRIGERKGTGDLIRAFQKVKISCPNAQLELAGDGDIEKFTELASELEVLDSIKFLGWVSGNKKLSVLKTADIYCLPSYNEGFPMGVIEAMSAGVCVVSTYAGGIPDAIESGKDGLLVNAGDIEALAQAIINLIQDRELNRKLVEVGKIKFEEHFSQQAILPQLQLIYNILQNKVGLF
ncbi:MULTISPECIES: glycosyltransferase family 4 protein [unclassified Pseudoalteromonas]|uniref:glycosyltransferase family 4 protein n=1 Tax=unclassified Pseudoalteromonas TaxID=194690 RepID=UPI000465E819|nr:MULTISPECIES: glycosyltransferase family 4 protein [unclassified Pseudoalteromonas]